jgi:hypothetical protein
MTNRNSTTSSVRVPAMNTSAHASSRRPKVTVQETAAQHAARLETELKAAKKAAQAEAEAERRAAASAEARRNATPPPALNPQSILAQATTVQLETLLHGMGYVPKRAVKRSEEVVKLMPEREYAKTTHLQSAIESLMTKQKGVVRVPDIMDHITTEDGREVTPSAARRHLEIMASKRQVFIAYEPADVPGRGLQLVAAKDPLTLAEVLDRGLSKGKKGGKN